MRNFTLFLFSITVLLLGSLEATAQKDKIMSPRRCSTMEEMEKAIKNNPALLDQWKAEGERRYNAYLQQLQSHRPDGTNAGEIIIPIVFHLVDTAASLAGITDRDIYEQVEILNRDYSGKKIDNYVKVIPPEIFSRVGHVPIKFVLARRTPGGAATTGIERRVNRSPNRIDIKSTAAGGLDPWDETKYLNIWAGTFSGADAGLLGIATFPFVTTEGPQGAVIGISTLPFTSNTARSYYPNYSEGATLSHEVGHYLYLWHTFGDQTTCNNDDFRIQAGWPLPAGAGPEGDDTPPEQAGPGNAYFGNPSMNFAGLCAAVPAYGIVYGSYMNYFDDRALFMFTDGMRKRVEGCIDLYRPGLKTSNGATPLAGTVDAFLVTVTPRGTPERVNFQLNNTPLKATVRNSGIGALTSVTLNVRIDAGAPTSTVFPLSLAPGSDTTLNLAPIAGAAGNHILTVYTTAPNTGADSYTNNDTLQSFVNIRTTTITAPFTETFTSTTFPPANWAVYNPNPGSTTWRRTGTSGYTATGAAYVANFDFREPGTLDELISPLIDISAADTATLVFKVAHGAYDTTDVSAWDGLEVYISGDGGITYTLAYKKTGKQLRTVIPAEQNAFTASPAEPNKWREESISLLPYMTTGKKVMIKFRNTNAYGNNIILDDINIAVGNYANRDAFVKSVLNVPPFICGGGSITPTMVFGTNGLDTLRTLKLNYRLDNGNVSTTPWTGVLGKGQTAQMALAPLTNVPSGIHTITFFTSEPNGLSDQYTPNDTLKLSFVVFSVLPAPVKEGFESATFPPANWVLLKSNTTYTWERQTKASNEGVAAAWIRNRNLNGKGATDDLYSPVITITAPDSVFVDFDVSHTGIQYPGSTALPLDTLQVMITKDCGQTFTTVYKKWGEDLQTVGDPNFSPAYSPTDTLGFVPSGKGQWRSESINLSALLGGTTGNFQVVFRNINNNGNNTFLDNINIRPVIVPAKVKQQGYMITPNPSEGWVYVRHYVAPTSLKGITVINPAGQVVLEKQYGGNAQANIGLDLTSYAAGIYTIRLVYDNKVITQRVVKIK